jgi:hypothetical protein
MGSRICSERLDNQKGFLQRKGAITAVYRVRSSRLCEQSNWIPRNPEGMKGWASTGFVSGFSADACSTLVVGSGEARSSRQQQQQRQWDASKAHFLQHPAAARLPGGGSSSRDLGGSSGPRLRSLFLVSRDNSHGTWYTIPTAGGYTLIIRLRRMSHTRCVKGKKEEGMLHRFCYWRGNCMDEFGEVWNSGYHYITYSSISSRSNQTSYDSQGISKKRTFKPACCCCIYIYISTVFICTVH